MAVMARMDWGAITYLWLPSNGMWHWNNTSCTHTHTHTYQYADSGASEGHIKGSHRN